MGRDDVWLLWDGKVDRGELEDRNACSYGILTAVQLLRNVEQTPYDRQPSSTYSVYTST